MREKGSLAATFVVCNFASFSPGIICIESHRIVLLKKKAKSPNPEPRSIRTYAALSRRNNVIEPGSSPGERQSVRG